MSDQEDSRSKKSLKMMPLQDAASDTENIVVGRSIKSLKHQLSGESPDVEVKKKNTSNNYTNKETQASLSNKITVDDLTNPKGASVRYWKSLAETRQTALTEVSMEKEQLLKIVEELKEKNATLKKMLEEANSFIEVIKEELDTSNNDTGIDVNDVTADLSSESNENSDDSEQQITADNN